MKGRSTYLETVDWIGVLAALRRDEMFRGIFRKFPAGNTFQAANFR